MEWRRKLCVQTAGTSPGLPWVSRTRLWGQAQQSDMFPASLWLLKLLLHLEKMLPWNVYSLWAEADVDPAHKPRTSARMFVAVCSAPCLRAPGSRRVAVAELGEQHPSCLDTGWWALQGKHVFVVGPRRDVCLHLLLPLGVPKINFPDHQINDTQWTWWYFYWWLSIV